MPTARQIAQKRTGCRLALLVVATVALALHSHAGLAADDIGAFDIAAQSLAVALERYSAMTGEDLLYNSNLASGRTSTSVHGTMSAAAALTAMLADTGLRSRRLASGSILLSPIPSVLEPHISSATADYYGLVQTRLRRALCSDDRTRPGRYRIALRLSINPAGRLTRYEQFGFGGDAAADGAMRRVLTSLDFGAAPPAEVRQPIVMVILPQAPGVTMGCDDVAGNSTRTAQ